MHPPLSCLHPPHNEKLNNRLEGHLKKFKQFTGRSTVHHKHLLAGWKHICWWAGPCEIRGVALFLSNAFLFAIPLKVKNYSFNWSRAKQHCFMSEGFWCCKGNVVFMSYKLTRCNCFFPVSSVYTSTSHQSYQLTWWDLNQKTDPTEPCRNTKALLVFSHFCL